MKKLFISCLVLFLALQLNAQTSADFSATYRCIESKNYYFTYLLQEKPEMKALLATSPKWPKPGKQTYRKPGVQKNVLPPSNSPTKRFRKQGKHCPDYTKKATHWNS